MKVIDILVNIADKEEGNFKFWVNSGIGDSSTCINWVYKDGYVRSVDNDADFFYLIYKDVYKLTDEVEIIEDKPEEEEIKELPLLEYIKMEPGNKMTYGSWTSFFNEDSQFLALVINRLIREVEDLKHNMEAMDKSMKEEAENWNCRLQSIERNEGYGL